MTKKVKLKELEQQCLEAEKAFKALQEQLQQAKKEEEEAKQAKLQAEKEQRYEEVIEAYKHFEQLKSEYLSDYGQIFLTTANDKENSHSWFWNAVGLY
jgi:biopolymer transport protein ExbD